MLPRSVEIIKTAQGLAETAGRLRDPVMLNFAPDESGLPATRGFSAYDGVTVRAEEMEE